MTTIEAPAGLVRLDAPLPTPRQFDLLAAATLIEPDDQRWLSGAWTGGDVPGPAYTHDPCSTGTDRQKADAGEIGDQQSFTFNVYLPGFCTAQSIGPDPKFWTDRLLLAFKAYEGAAVERVLATGDGHGTLGPYLGDTDLEVLGGGAVDPVEGLALLEQEISLNGTGIIHCDPATFTAWVANYLVEPKGAVMRTYLGTPVAVGAGYIGVVPDGEAALGDTQGWAFATGPIEIRRETNPNFAASNYADVFDRSLNDVNFIAERPYLFNWMARTSSSDDDHIQAGVLIDRATGT